MTRDADSAPNAKPGWYPDPSQPETVRFWDGEDWTEQRGPASGAPSGPRPGSRRLLLGGGALVVIAVIVVAVILLAGGSSSTELVHIPVPSASMAPTFKTGEIAAVNPDAYETNEPEAGDIVVFHPPAGAESASECGLLVNGLQPLEAGEPCPKPTTGEASQTFIKRIVAVGGDSLSIKDGHPVVNGVEKTDEPYIRPCGGGYECNLPRTITIPPGYFFMLGDNRGESDDSRYWGPVPAAWILGRVEG